MLRLLKAEGSRRPQQVEPSATVSGEESDALTPCHLPHSGVDQPFGLHRTPTLSGREDLKTEDMLTLILKVSGAAGVLLGTIQLHLRGPSLELRARRRVGGLELVSPVADHEIQKLQVGAGLHLGHLAFLSSSATGVAKRTKGLHMEPAGG